MLHTSDHGLILTAWIVAGASSTEVVGVHGSSLKIRVATPATGGLANDALVRFLRKRLGCPVSIVSGGGARRKQIHIESGDLAGIERALGIAPD